MYKEISTNELRNNLGEILNQVNYKHETFIVCKGGKPFAAVIDLETLNQLKKSKKEKLLSLISEFNSDNDESNENDIIEAMQHVRPGYKK